MAAVEQATLRFDGPGAFREWIEEHQDSSPGIWLVMAKKGSGQTTVTYAEALDVALAYGWIDGQARRVDEATYVQRFTPRRPRSPWSLRNVRTAEAMIADGRMNPRGLAEVERARSDGRWERAYAGPKTAEPHPDFLAALAANPAAGTFFDTLNSQNRYAIYYRIQDAKRPETRARRIEAFVDRLARGEKFYE
jgi:uncharacterized protein YdeI (YjbR/CyaY-like superfamily)